MGADYLALLCADLLDAAADGLTLARTGNVAPSRQYHSHGVPPVDGCDDPTFTGQLTVHIDDRRGVWNKSLPDRPGVPRTMLLAPAAVLVVQLWRCVPVSADDKGTPPAADTLNASAEELAKDAWSMYTQIVTEHFANSLFTGANCENVTIGDLIPLPPQGGMGGWELRVEVLLNDAGP